MNQQDSAHLGQVLRESPDMQHPQSSRCTRFLSLLNSLKFCTRWICGSSFKTLTPCGHSLPAALRFSGPALRKQVSHNEP